MKLANTRAIIDAIHSGALAGAKTVRDPVFGFGVVTECPGVPPRNSLAARELGRPGSLRCHGAEAGRSFHKELCDLRRRRQRRGEGRRADRLRVSGPEVFTPSARLPDAEEKVRETLAILLQGAVPAPIGRLISEHDSFRQDGITNPFVNPDFLTLSPLKSQRPRCHRASQQPKQFNRFQITIAWVG